MHLAAWSAAPDRDTTFQVNETPSGDFRLHVDRNSRGKSWFVSLARAQNPKTVGRVVDAHHASVYLFRF